MLSVWLHGHKSLGCLSFVSFGLCSMWHFFLLILCCILSLQSIIAPSVTICWIMWVFLMNHQTWGGLGDPQHRRHSESEAVMKQKHGTLTVGSSRGRAELETKTRAHQWCVVSSAPVSSWICHLELEGVTWEWTYENVSSPDFSFFHMGYGWSKTPFYGTQR